MNTTKCNACGQVGKFTKETYPILGHPNLEETWLTCECGHEQEEIK